MDSDTINVFTIQDSSQKVVQLYQSSLKPWTDPATGLKLKTNSNIDLFVFFH